ncbi:PAS domain-containing sensor histidine kinase, partial [Candidatus Dojkabacteria bacterium]|nr:PAS domain-containing sensor histidine kinase [Candidatus Dojkabacteria bacterium]
LLLDSIREKIDLLVELNDKLLKENIKDQAIFNSIGEGFVTIDLVGNVTFINQKAKNLLKVGESFWENKNWLSDYPKFQTLAGETVALEDRLVTHTINQKDIFTKKFILVLNDESKLPVNLTSAPIIQDDKVIGVVKVFRDITLEMQVDKAKSEFLQIASHQLRTPLSSIRWNMDILTKTDLSALDENQLKFLKNIEISTKNMVNLISSLLQLTKIELGTLIYTPTEVDLSEIFEEVREGVDHLITKKELTINVIHQQNDEAITTDPNLLKILMQCLLENAVKYSYERTQIEVVLKIENGEIIISVKDEGIGIPQNELGSIMEKNYRASNVISTEDQGSGLGLYIANQIITKVLSGKISIESEINKGSRFTINIPIVDKN